MPHTFFKEHLRTATSKRTMTALIHWKNTIDSSNEDNRKNNAIKHFSVFIVDFAQSFAKW